MLGRHVSRARIVRDATCNLCCLGAATLIADERGYSGGLGAKLAAKNLSLQCKQNRDIYVCLKFLMVCFASMNKVRTLRNKEGDVATNTYNCL